MKQEKQITNSVDSDNIYPETLDLASQPVTF